MREILRVISGTAKGHKLKTVDSVKTRPTSDRVKESIFNIIFSLVPDAYVLDLFAGTGNLGIEALSRGAKECVFIDKSGECSSIIKQNLQHTRLEEQGQVIQKEVAKAIKVLPKDRRFDIIFMDPPYNKNFIPETLKLIVDNDIINKNGIIVAEYDIDDNAPEQVDALKAMRICRYGDTVVSFYSIAEEVVD